MLTVSRLARVEIRTHLDEILQTGLGKTGCS